MTGERKVSQTRSRRTRLIRPQIHALLDAVSSALLLTAPVPARFRPVVRFAGMGVAAYSILTRYDVDSKKPISMTSHLALDAAQGAGFVAAALYQMHRGQLGLARLPTEFSQSQRRC